MVPPGRSGRNPINGTLQARHDLDALAILGEQAVARRLRAEIQTSVQHVMRASSWSLFDDTLERATEEALLHDVQWLSSTRSIMPYSSACSAEKKWSRSISARTSSLDLSVCSA